LVGALDEVTFEAKLTELRDAGGLGQKSAQQKAPAYQSKTLQIA
jgi:hypothetical protein